MTRQMIDAIARHNAAFLIMHGLDPDTPTIHADPVDSLHSLARMRSVRYGAKRTRSRAKRYSVTRDGLIRFPSASPRFAFTRTRPTVTVPASTVFNDMHHVPSPRVRRELIITRGERCIARECTLSAMLGEATCMLHTPLKRSNIARDNDRLPLPCATPHA